MPTFQRGLYDLHYEVLGSGPGVPVVLLHGLLYSSALMERLARLLDGREVLLLDLHGHGLSSRPTDVAAYSWESFSDDVVGLLDHRDVDRAVVGGLSLGANVTLAVAYRHPERTAGLVIEMPVLSRGYPIGRTVFGAMARLLRLGDPLLVPLTSTIRRLPVPGWAPEVRAVRDVAGFHPGAARALLVGLLDDERVPDDPVSLAQIKAPSLVVGHHLDPLHHIEDARDLARDLPDGRLVEASTIVDHRLRPGLLAGVIASFLEDVDRLG